MAIYGDAIWYLFSFITIYSHPSAHIYKVSRYTLAGSWRHRAQLYAEKSRANSKNVISHFFDSRRMLCFDHLGDEKFIFNDIFWGCFGRCRSCSWIVYSFFLLNWQRHLIWQICYHCNRFKQREKNKKPKKIYDLRNFSIADKYLASFSRMSAPNPRQVSLSYTIIMINR